MGPEILETQPVAMRLEKASEQEIKKLLSLDKMKTLIVL